MKRLALLLLLFTPLAHAHVLLTTPYSVSGPLGVATCSAPHMTATSTSSTPSPGGVLTSISIVYSLGTATVTGGVDTAFTIASCAPSYTLTLSNTGAWTLTLNGYGVVGGGTLSNTQTTSAFTVFEGPEQALDDYADYFLTLSGGNFLSSPIGTQPYKWNTSDQ